MLNEANPSHIDLVICSCNLRISFFVMDNIVVKTRILIFFPMGLGSYQEEQES
jgi:hypothetical protein